MPGQRATSEDGKRTNEVRKEDGRNRTHLRAWARKCALPCMRVHVRAHASACTWQQERERYLVESDREAVQARLEALRASNALRNAL